MKKDTHRIPYATWLLFGLLAVVTAGLLIGGHAYYRRQVRDIRQEKDTYLEDITELKVGQIAAWRKERIADARVQSSAIARMDVMRWIRDPDNATGRAGLVVHLKALCDAYGYQNIILVDPDSKVLVSLDTRLTQLEASARQLVMQVVTKRAPIFGDLYRCPDCGQIHLDVAAPILDENQRPVAVLLLRNDPQVALYPLVQSWPTSSVSAETLLVRKDGDNVLFLNTLRHSAAPALTLTVPVARTDLPAARALAGQTGIFEGKDYRGVVVESYMHAVPGSPWVMIAKMDMSEILAAARYQSGVVTLFLALGMLMVGILMMLVFSYRQRDVYKQLYHVAEKERQAQEEIHEHEEFSRSVLDAIGANVAVLNRQGVIIAVNAAWDRFACDNGDTSGGAATGLGADYLAVTRAALGASTEGAAESLAGIEDVLAGRLPKLTTEYPCHSPDTQRWFMLCATPLAGKNGGVVLAHIDITARKQAAHDLQASETRYRRLFESAKDGILILDAATGRIVDVNPFLVDLLGYTHAEILGKYLWETGVFKDEAASKDAFLKLQAQDYVRYENLPLETKDGRQIEVEFVSNVYLVNSTKVVQCNIRDITMRSVLEKRRELTMDVLATLNRGNDISRLVGDILQMIKRHTGVEAVGVRLREGDDFPYYETDGFSEEFVDAERYLCSRDASGKRILDADGKPVLECMCGNVLSDRFDASQSFFTAGGSFWTNSTTALLASTSEQNLGDRMLNRCNPQGYESLALIPLRIGHDIIGLIQMSDHHKGLFVPEEITFLEELGAAIGVAVVRRRAVASLQTSEERYRQVFATAGDAMFLLDQASGAILDTNTIASQLYGYTREEFLTLRNADLSAEPQETTQALAQELHEVPLRYHRRKDGTVFPVEIIASYYVQDGRRISVVDIRDISARERARQQEEEARQKMRCHLEESQQSRRALLSMMEDQRRGEQEREHIRAQLQQAQKLESIGTLAGGVAHEINNPIMGIMNYAQLIIDELDPDSPVVKYATVISGETDRVATIVKNLLSFARQDDETHGSLARICDVVESTLSLCRAVMRYDQITLEIDVPDDLPLVMCRSQQLRQVVMNLLTNARDALNEKYPAHDDNKKIRITARVIQKNGTSWIRVTVEDRGPGIPEELRPRIFDPFFTSKPRDKGTGLGLSISHGIVHDHGGELIVESEVGEGTQVHMDLPLGSNSREA